MLSCAPYFATSFAFASAIAATVTRAAGPGIIVGVMTTGVGAGDDVGAGGAWTLATGVGLLPHATTVTSAARSFTAVVVSPNVARLCVARRTEAARHRAATQNPNTTPCAAAWINGRQRRSIARG